MRLFTSLVSTLSTPLAFSHAETKYVKAFVVERAVSVFSPDRTIQLRRKIENKTRNVKV